MLGALIPIESTAGWLWFAFTCLVGLVWLRRLKDLARARRDDVLTPADADAESAELPSISMIVAAKDEQENIGRCVEGLLAQDYPKLQLIFVNDRSTDRTAALIDQAAARDERVTAVHVRELRQGWFGKNNAMREGVQRATGDWLCFSDADCTFESTRLLSASIKYAMNRKIDFLSVLPRLEASTFWEKVVQPVAGAVLVFWFPPEKVNDPRSSRAYANGAFMLLSRATYDDIGGHEPVKTEVNEDMHMARLAKQAGHALRVVRSAGMYRVRMYSGFGEIWRGWSRIFYGCFGTLPRLLVSVAFLALFSLSPYVTLLLSFLAGDAAVAFALAAGAAIIAQQTVLWQFWKLSQLPPYWATTYPLGATICLGMILSAMTKLGGLTATSWRGTKYRGHALDERVESAAETSSPTASFSATTTEQRPAK